MESALLEGAEEWRRFSELHGLVYRRTRFPACVRVMFGLPGKLSKEFSDRGAYEVCPDISEKRIGDDEDSIKRLENRLRKNLEDEIDQHEHCVKDKQATFDPIMEALWVDYLSNCWSGR